MHTTDGRASGAYKALSSEVATCGAANVAGGSAHLAHASCPGGCITADEAQGLYSCGAKVLWGYDPGGSRTRDLRIKSPLLYQLSYRVYKDLQRF